MKSLLLLALLLTSTAQARILEGDWESAGAPPAPYDPPYEFSYSCQAELTDGKVHSGKAGNHKFYAVANFELKNETRFVREIKTWKYLKVGANGEETELGSRPAKMVATEGHSFGLGLGRRADGDDEVLLSASVRQLLGGEFEVVKHELARFKRSNERLWLKAYAEARSLRAREGEYLGIYLYLGCVKKK